MIILVNSQRDIERGLQEANSFKLTGRQRWVKPGHSRREPDHSPKTIPELYSNSIAFHQGVEESNSIPKQQRP